VAADASPPAVREGLRRDIARAALAFLGRPYRWGAADGAFDCSGLTMTAYRLHGLGLPRSSAEQYALGTPVAAGQLQEADLVFFDTGARGGPDHVGLYVGEGRFVHAPGEGKVVRVDDLASAWYSRRFLAGRSYLE
jgi:cell wall-associated NlpC family hydrolase